MARSKTSRKKLSKKSKCDFLCGRLAILLAGLRFRVPAALCPLPGAFSFPLPSACKSFCYVILVVLRSSPRV